MEANYQSEAQPPQTRVCASGLKADLEHRERQIHAIRRITNALFSHSFVDDMLRETLGVAIEVLQADVGSLQLHDPQSDCLVFRYVMDPQAQHLAGHAYPASQGIGGQVFRTGAPQLTNKVKESAEFNRTVDQLTGYQTESMLTVPLKRFEGKPIGVMQILNARRAFDERDLEVLEVLSAQAAAAIETARLAQEAKRAEIVNVLGDVSHDIKNMITPIQSGLMMLQPMLDETIEAIDALSAEGPGARTWQDALQGVASIARDEYGWIIENALDSTEKVQARTKEIADAVKGELAPPVFEVADLNETARSVMRSLRLMAESKSVALRPDFEFDLPLVEFDRKQLYNALYNLVNNAIPETPSGGQVILRTRALPQDNENSYEPMVLIQVQDMGCGIPEHVRARLFTDQAISTKEGGTGLGTRIVHGIVQRHGGTITVESREGEGSTFSIRLPLRQK